MREYIVVTTGTMPRTIKADRFFINTEDGVLQFDMGSGGSKDNPYRIVAAFAKGEWHQVWENLGKVTDGSN